MDVNWNYEQFNEYPLYEQPDIPNHVELQPTIGNATLDCSTLNLQNSFYESNDDSQITAENSAFFDDPTTMNPYVGSDGNYKTCTLCIENNTNFKCIELRDIIKHLWEIHNEKLYICNVCKEQFHYYFELSKHIKIHVCNNENKKWKCTMCPKKFASRNILEEHEHVHSGLRPYKCTQCGKSYRSKYTLKTHLTIHIKDRNRQYQCMSCLKFFLSKQNLKQHEAIHKHTREFSCTLCDNNRKFTTENNLMSHMITHDGNRKFFCTVCDKRFARKAELVDHERIHTGQRPFVCEMCPLTFTQRSNLQSHMNATHYNIKRNICEECGKGFKRKRLLTYHMNAVHTKIRPFKCTQCEKDFVYPEHLKKHMLNLHENEKPYHCGICNKNFSSRDNYNSHLYSHTNKKQYECITCGVGFTRKPALKKHMESTKHGNGKYNVNHIKADKKDPEASSVVVTTYCETKQMDDMTNLYVKNRIVDEDVSQDYENTNQYYSYIQEPNVAGQILQDQYGQQYLSILCNGEENLQYGYENDGIPLSTEGYSNEYDNNQNDPMEDGTLQQIEMMVGNEVKYFLCEVLPTTIEKKPYNRDITCVES